jgi:flagellar motility protein MotE (MotC chaperone)
MKKYIIALNVAMILFFVVKIFALGGAVENSLSASTAPVPEKNPAAEAAGKAQAPAAPVAADLADDGLAKPRGLLAALETKKKELEQREQVLKSEEQRMLALKKEIVEKIDLLRVEQEKMDTLLKNVQNVDNKRYKELAKVFDAAPPAKAGAMLEQMDLKTAAGITMNMKKDKAGLILGFLSPHKAIEITREITRASKQ